MVCPDDEGFKLETVMRRSSFEARPSGMMRSMESPVKTRGWDTECQPQHFRQVAFGQFAWHRSKNDHVLQ